LYGFPKPLICAANGAAMAGGLFFILVSDYCVANERAVFALAEMRVGLRFPVGPFEIARNELAPHACRRIMLSGATHDAATALQLGVIDEAVAAEEVMERATTVAGDSDPMSAGWSTDESVVATKAMLASLQRK